MSDPQPPPVAPPPESAPAPDALALNALVSDTPAQGQPAQTPSIAAAQPPSAPAEDFFDRPARPSATPANEGTTPGMAQRQADSRAEIQDFLRVLSIFGGNIPQVYIDHVSVAGDMPVGTRAAGEVYPPPKRVSAEVSPAEIAKVRRVCQRTAAYPLALQALRQQHCVVLMGQPGVGKRCAAIRLAAELLGDTSEVAIRELPADDDLAQQVQTFVARPNVAYLVDGLLAGRGRELTPLAARAMVDTLRTHNCYLIICARPGVPLPRDLTIVPLEAPSISAAALVELHLAYYDSLSPDEICEALAHPEIAAILNAGLTPALADRLADQLAVALRSGREYKDAIPDAIRGFDATTEDDVQRWFDEAGDDLQLRAIRIALAVFNGARFDPLYSAAKALETALRPPPVNDKEEKKPAPSPFARKQSDLLAGAIKIRRPLPTYYSDRVMVEVVELINPNYSPALLKYLWEHLDLREPLLDWLMRYAVDARSPQEIRLRAAAALGALAGFDFETIRVRVFQPWAFGETSDNNERRRRYAALSNALGMLIWNDECDRAVCDLLGEWSEGGSDSARWAAARAYAQVGLRHPHDAMKQWRRILESKGKIELRLTESFGFVIPHPLHMSVVDAIVSLFLRAVELPHRLRPIYEQALEGLSAWVEADAADPNAEQVGLPLFVALTAIRQPPDSGDGDPEQWPPAMLTIVGTQPDSTYRRILAGLLRRAVRHPTLQAQAIAALRTWAEAAEHDPWLEQTLGAVLAEWLALPGTGERDRGILRMHLSRWAGHPKQPLMVAGRLLIVLKLV